MTNYTSSRGAVYTGMIELIGKDEAITQNHYCASVAVPVSVAAMGYRLTNVIYFSEEDGSGSVQTPAGTLFLYLDDPAIAANDAAQGQADWQQVIYYNTIASASWVTDAGGGVLFSGVDVLLPIPADAQNFYASFYMTSAAGINDAEGDDEIISFGLVYETL